MTTEDKEISTQTNSPDWKINGRVLCIADIHQNIEWVKAILHLEKDNYDHVVFLGDFFDSFWDFPKVATVTKTAEFVIEIINGTYGPATICAGNHDISYMEAWRKSSKFQNPKFLLNYCSGYTNSKSKDINTTLTWSHWKKFKLFALVNGVLLTHAGLRGNNFRPFLDPERSLVCLEQEFNDAVNHIGGFAHHLFAVGQESGGRAAFGGPLWLRPQHFVDDEIPYPQMFGHTHTGKGIVKQYGRSFCIDGGQTSYAIIHPDGRIEAKTCEKMESNMANLEYPFMIHDAQIQKWRNEREQIEAIDNNIKRLVSGQPYLEDDFYPKVTEHEVRAAIEASINFQNFVDKSKDDEEKEKRGETIVYETPEEHIKRMGTKIKN